MTLSKAFTFIELLVAIAIGIILLLVGVPTMQEIINKNRIIADVDQIVSGLYFARSMAIKLGEPITFCGSSNYKSCSGSWQDGQIIIVSESSKEVLQVLPKVIFPNRLSGNFKNATITFLPVGFIKGRKGSIYYCPKKFLHHARAIIIEFSGRVRIDSKTAQGKIIPCSF
jgi:type IV fimbrial biogenesis protein FimT